MQYLWGRIEDDTVTAANGQDLLARPPQISRTTLQPVYDQVSGILRSWVDRTPPGTQLPTEARLMEHFGVSRSTIRRALTTMVEDGLLMRHQGKGTFTAQRRLVHSLNRIQPIVSMFTEANESVESEVLGYEWVTDTAEFPSVLAGTDGGALRVIRYFKSESGARVLAVIHLPWRIGREFSRADMERSPVYHLLKERLGVQPEHADVTIRASPRPRIAEQLEIGDLPELVILLKRTTYDADHQPLEHTNLYLHPDAFEFKLSLDTESATHLDHEFMRQTDLEVTPRVDA